MTHFNFSGLAPVKDLDMLHALDYGELNLKQLQTKISERRVKDKVIEKSMELEIFILPFCANLIPSHT